MNLKGELIKAPVLATPDFNKKFIIQCDASNESLGTVLVQMDDETNKEKPIAYISRRLRGAELNYTTTEKECLSVVFAIEKFRHYVEGFKFEVITDHSALLWLFKQANLSGRLARWIMKLQQFDFDIKHVKGKNNVVPDALSRIPSIELIDIELNDTDQWYRKLREKIKSSPNRFKDYKIVDNNIYIKITKHTSEQFPFKLVVPHSQRIKVIKECHDSPMSAHLGTFKTTNRILQKYYWPGVALYVKNYVRNCHVCLQSKSTTQRPYGTMGKMKKASYAWEVCSMDLMGPLVRSSKCTFWLYVIGSLSTR